MYVCTYRDTYVHMNVCSHVPTYVHMYLCMYKHMYVPMHLPIFVRTHVCIKFVLTVKVQKKLLGGEVVVITICSDLKIMFTSHLITIFSHLLF